MKKILIVDGHLQCKLIKYILKKQEYLISESEDGLDAMEKLGSLERLIIVDLNMPNMDGIQFGRIFVAIIIIWIPR